MKYSLSKYLSRFRQHLYFSSTDVMTPVSLAKKMVGKLFEEMTDDPSVLKTKKFVDPSCGTGVFLAVTFDYLFYLLIDEIPDNKERARHILENQLYGVDVNQVKLKLAKRFLDHKGRFDLNLICDDSLECDWNMEFDVVVGNPPYQKNYGAAASDSIWNKFVDKSLDLLKDGGWMSLIHPSGWRNVDGKFKKVQQKLLSYDLRYLNLNTVDDGRKVFGAATPFDWYVLRKNKKSSSTTIVTIENEIIEKNISNSEFIPNAKFETVFSLLADKDEESVEILHSWSDYESRKDYINKEKKGDYIHPCVRYVYQDERGIDCYYSNTQEHGHFGIPKVMVGRMSNTGRITVDEDGEYGLTEYMFGIIDNPENLQKIKEAMDSEEFRQIMDLCRFNTIMYNRKIISLFRKDFWKKFVGGE